MLDMNQETREKMLANAISQAIKDHYGWRPLYVRYGAAEAALAYLRADDAESDEHRARDD